MTSDNDPSPTSSNGIKCANPECEQEAGKLICPDCKAAQVPLHVSSFCSQECFKTFWPIHKLTHEFGSKKDPATPVKA